jgi:hypothetical protein
VAAMRRIEGAAEEANLFHAAKWLASASRLRHNWEGDEQWANSMRSATQ